MSSWQMLLLPIVVTAVSVLGAANSEENLDLYEPDSARPVYAGTPGAAAAQRQPVKAAANEKGASLLLSIEPQFRFFRQGYMVNGDTPDFMLWEKDFSLCIGIRPAYSFTNDFSMYLTFDNFLQRPHDVLMMQTYLGIGLSIVFSRKVPVFMGGDLGYCYWYYPGNNLMNSSYRSDGFGCSFAVGYEITRRIAVATHFAGLFPQKKISDFFYGPSTVLIQSNTLGARLVYKVRKYD